MSGQHSPHDTGREENPAETDLGKMSMPQLEVELERQLVGATKTERLLVLVIRELQEVNTHLERIADHH